MEPFPFDCYAALRARDPRFDGHFFVAVTTTGIYCRPVCPARTPKPDSCRFLATAAAAEQAGFRPCLRCRPEVAPSAPAVSLEQALYAAIRARATQGDSVAELAERAGFSTRQLRRLMVQGFGVTPVEIMQTERLLFARKLLRETRLGAAEIALSAGFKSLRRFNALFQSRYALSPTRLRRQGSAGSPAATAPDTLHLRLPYRPPLAWAEMLAYLQRRAVPGVEAISLSTLSYARTVSGSHGPGWVQVSRAPSGHWLEVTFPSSLAGDSWRILSRLRALFDLDANPAAIESHLQSDPFLAPSLARHPGLRVPGTWSVFALAVRAVLGQQISVAGASTFAGRLAARFGERVEGFHPGLHRLPLSAETLAATSVPEIAAIGLPQARAATLRELAEAAVNGALSFGPGTTMDQATASLRQIRGIGEWTAQYVAMRALRFPDAFPAGDLGLRQAMAPPGRPLPTEKQLLQRAAAWRPWRAYAALHLWQSLHDSADPHRSSK